MLLAGGQGGFSLPVIWDFRPGGADYAHHNITCPPGFENQLR